MYAKLKKKNGCLQTNNKYSIPLFYFVKFKNYTVKFNQLPLILEPLITQVSMLHTAN